MDAELKAKWVSALRSGDYEQARESLVRHWDKGEVAYCCLGVLCMLVPGVQWTSDDVFYYDEDGDRSDGDGELPVPVRELVGIQAPVMAHLIGMNDGQVDMPAKSFPEIADWIEANL